MLNTGGADRRRCAVLGTPIAHSLSPVLHRAAYASLGLAWTYDAVEVAESDLTAFIAGLGAEWIGLSLTMPLKAAGLALAADADSVARHTRVANTLVRRDSAWFAHNTDAPALRRALVDAGVIAGGTACVLGGGATARSSIWALADRVAAVRVLVRDPARAAALTELGQPMQVEVGLLNDPAERQHALAADIVVNTTPPGSVDWLAAEVQRHSGTYVDWTYEPWPTPLATAHASAGRTVIGGLELLLFQAALQVEIMTGRAAPLAAMQAAL